MVIVVVVFMVVVVVVVFLVVVFLVVVLVVCGPKTPPKHQGPGGIQTVEELVEPGPPNPDLLSSFFPT